ncbi:MAG TPA: hypothetical protein VM597_20355 [Gemmataceae bacterium]|nr:hypothetical protein [Gemmataceae bacterium]
MQGQALSLPEGGLAPLAKLPELKLLDRTGTDVPGGPTWSR